MKRSALLLVLALLGASAHSASPDFSGPVAAMDAKKRSAYCGGGLASAAQIFYKQGAKEKARQVAKLALWFWPSYGDPSGFDKWEFDGTWGALEMFGQKNSGQRLGECAQYANSSISAEDRMAADEKFDDWFDHLLHDSRKPIH